MKIIVNPQAGHGRFGRRFTRLHRALKDWGLQAEVVETRYPGHATELARQAAAEAEQRLLVMGGDGTLSEVANGLVNTSLALGIIPCGTGNDLARSLGVPLDSPEAALRRALEGIPKAIDLGYDGQRYFISVLGIGFPTEVALTANRFHKVRGPATFFLATYRELWRMKPAPVVLRLDGRTVEMECTSVMVQNTRYTGGGLLIAPEAELDDGYLDVVVVDDIGRLGLMLNFPKLYRGTHLEHPSFYSYRVKELEIESPVRLRKMTDGDFSGFTPAGVAVVAKALTVIT